VNETDGDPGEENRTLVNIALAVGFLVLIGSGIWLVDAMLDARRADECMSSGRRNCFPVETPTRAPQ
jgi:hypothetical protein